ncbi:MAG: winged helix-turn-helix transcriptional regulator, partial [Burkholderiales bacterium]|nr:winged helix-turn-helix transcriptional regulator [Burkholderiales bacterium]
PARGGLRVKLTATETALLQALLSRPGAVLTRRELQARLAGRGSDTGSSLDVLIHGIRRKLGADVIRNVRGAGWMIDDIE